MLKVHAFGEAHGHEQIFLPDISRGKARPARDAVPACQHLFGPVLGI
ncbi:hypothetical protein BMS3Bbin10_01850 [bacterium BMS3Bbin10]|nr:hypothetical protein BMS3Bbin10_01850 [bacterium BMS3Bbin10]